MQIIVEEQVVGYDRAGKGKTVVLLHGWGASRDSLSMIAKELSGSYDVISVDVPGFGQSEAPQQAWTLSDYASWLLECLKKLGVDRVFVMVGHSNGGAIAIKSVASGMVIEKLILLGASGVRNRENGKKLFLRSAAKAGKYASKLLPARAQKRLRTKWYKKIGSELYDRAGMEDTFKKVVAEDLLVDAATISVPTLLLYGSEDRATPPIYGQLYARVIEQSELHIVESAGHYCFVDQPEVVNTYIQKFLQS